MKGLLDPKMDFVFKNIFGSEKHPNILISFLNATLKPKDLITAVEIREAKDELIRMSNDDAQRELYEMRAKTLKDKISALNEAERKGMQKGIKEGEKNKAIEIAKSMINIGLDKDTIAKSTGLNLSEVEKLID